MLFISRNKYAINKERTSLKENVYRNIFVPLFNNTKDNLVQSQLIMTSLAMTVKFVAFTAQIENRNMALYRSSYVKQEFRLTVENTVKTWSLLKVSNLLEVELKR